ncbi:MAG: helix-turn-helix domain-containing protein [Verrucomicrobiae bacterium]|nr:helix-turn-helix domain-containing protein [Verrucomicrobiae bacterium]
MEPARNDFFAPIDDILQILDVLEKMPGALFMIKDLDSRYVYMSQALREAIHIAPGQEVVGRTDFDLFPRIVAQNFRDNDLLVFRRGKPLVGEVHAAMFFEHAALWAISSKYPLRDRHGEIVGLITINEPYDEVAGEDDELNRLLPAIDHMSKYFAEPLTVTDLARRCGYSERHFMRLFRARMQVSPHRFLEQVRMFHAIDAIRRTNRPIAVIAEDCGFHDASAFVKRFKRFAGTTPLRYRREQQERVRREPAMAIPHPTHLG